MSAFIVSDEHIVSIVLTVEGLRQDKGYAPASLALLNGIATALYNENYRSVNDLYDNGVEREVPIHITTDDLNDASYILPLGGLVKAIHCYDYQSCETDDYRETVAAKFIATVGRDVFKLAVEAKGVSLSTLTPNTVKRLQRDNEAFFKSISPHAKSPDDITLYLSKIDAIFDHLYEASQFNEEVNSSPMEYRDDRAVLKAVLVDHVAGKVEDNLRDRGQALLSRATSEYLEGLEGYNETAWGIYHPHRHIIEDVEAEDDGTGATLSA